MKYKNIQCTRSGQVVRIDLEPVFALNPLARSPGQSKTGFGHVKNNYERISLNKYNICPNLAFRQVGEKK